MARTPTVTRDQVHEKYRRAFDQEVAISREAVENGPGSVMINSPEMRKRANRLVFYFRQESELPKKIQEMAMIMTARAKDCQYIWFAHAARARDHGISNEFVDALRDKMPLPRHHMTNRSSWTTQPSCSPLTESAKGRFKPRWTISEPNY